MKPEAKPYLNREVMATLRDVTLTYDGYLTRALSRLSLDLRKGEIMGVLGAKGAGKSTVLKILAGRLRPTEGSVKVFGRSPRGGAAKGRIGYLPGIVDPNHPPGFFSRLMGKKNEYPQTGRGLARLTQAFLGNRELLILDDPFAGLELAELAEARASVQEMAERGKTVILSSDALMEVRDLCQRMAIFHEGKLQAIGTLAELLAGGDAVRFLPTVLPREMVERVLKNLREEITGESVLSPAPAPSPKTSSARAASETTNAPAKEHPDKLLTSLTKPAENAPQALPKPKTEDPIDHDKLEGLVKPAKPE